MARTPGYSGGYSIPSHVISRGGGEGNLVAGESVVGGFPRE